MNASGKGANLVLGKRQIGHREAEVTHTYVRQAASAHTEMCISNPWQVWLV